MTDARERERSNGRAPPSYDISPTTRTPSITLGCNAPRGRPAPPTRMTAACRQRCAWNELTMARVADLALRGSAWAPPAAQSTGAGSWEGAPLDAARVRRTHGRVALILLRVGLGLLAVRAQSVPRPLGPRRLGLAARRPPRSRRAAPGCAARGRPRPPPASSGVIPTRPKRITAAVSRCDGLKARTTRCSCTIFLPASASDRLGARRRAAAAAAAAGLASTNRPQTGRRPEAST